MVVTACIAARDLPAALEAAEHLRASGRQLDTILYTNLITGAPTSKSDIRSYCLPLLQSEVALGPCHIPQCHLRGLSQKHNNALPRQACCLGNILPQAGC